MHVHIEHDEIPEGALIHRYYSLYAGHQLMGMCDIRSDSYYFNIYHRSGLPLGTVTRPRYDGKDQQDHKWRVTSVTGAQFPLCFGPRKCLRLFMEWLTTSSEADALLSAL